MMAKPKVEEPQIIEIINDAKTKEWNQAISPRLESLRAWFSSNEWKDGVLAYLNSVLNQRREHLERKGNEFGDDQFIKGQIAMLKQIMTLPNVIEKQIELAEKNKGSGSRGDAGY
jgi:hypothetical protein